MGLSDFVSKAKNAVSNAYKKVASGVSSVVNTVKTVSSNVVNTAQKAASSVVSTGMQAAKTVGTYVGQAASTGFSVAKSVVSTIPGISTIAAAASIATKAVKAVSGGNKSSGGSFGGGGYTGSFDTSGPAPAITGNPVGGNTGNIGGNTGVPLPNYTGGDRYNPSAFGRVTDFNTSTAPGTTSTPVADNLGFMPQGTEGGYSVGEGGLAESFGLTNPDGTARQGATAMIVAALVGAALLLQ